MKKTLFTLLYGITLIGNSMNGSERDHNSIIDHLKSMTPEEITERTNLVSLNQKLTLAPTKYPQLQAFKRHLEQNYEPEEAQNLFIKTVTLSVADARQGTKKAQTFIKSLLN